MFGWHRDRLRLASDRGRLVPGRASGGGGAGAPACRLWWQRMRTICQVGDAQALVGVQDLTGPCTTSNSVRLGASVKRLDSLPARPHLPNSRNTPELPQYPVPTPVEAYNAEAALLVCVRPRVRIAACHSGRSRARHSVRYDHCPDVRATTSW